MGNASPEKRKQKQKRNHLRLKDTYQIVNER